MNSDFRLSVGYFTHFKIVKLGRRLGDSAVLSHLRLLSYAAQERPTGLLHGMDSDDIAIASGYSGDITPLLTALLDLHLLDQDDDGVLSIHDWAEHNTWAAGAKNRAENARQAGAAKWGSDLEAANKQKRSERLSEARKKGQHTEQEWQEMKSYFNRACVRCGKAEPEIKIVKDHIIPIYQGGSDGLDNLQPLCKRCNSSKGAENKDWRQGWPPAGEEEMPATHRKTPAECLPNACLTDENACRMPAGEKKMPALFPSSPFLSSPSDSSPSVPDPSEANPNATTTPPTSPAADGQAAAPLPDPERQKVVVASLCELGVSEIVAEDLARRRSCEMIQKQVEWLPHRIKDRSGGKKPVRDPVALLVKAIEDGYAVPTSYSQEKQAQAEKERQTQKAEALLAQKRAEKAAAGLEARKLEDAWQRLAEDEQADIGQATEVLLLKETFFADLARKHPGDWRSRSDIGARMLTLRNAILAERGLIPMADQSVAEQNIIQGQVS